MFSRFFVLLVLASLALTGCERFETFKLETTFNGKVGEDAFTPSTSNAEVVGNDMTLTAYDFGKQLIIKTNKFQAAYFQMDTVMNEGVTSLRYRPVSTNELNQYIGYNGFIHIEYIGGGLVTGDYDVWARNQSNDTLRLVGNFIHVPVVRD